MYMKILKNIFFVLLLLIAISSIAIIILKIFIYPKKYINIIEENAMANKVNKYLILSIIKKESNFNTRVMSNKNAKGLMQILDSTAEEFSDNKEYDLFNVEDNVHIGVKYFKYLLDRYDGSIILALSAYNAGLGNVDNWICNKIIYTDEKIDILKIPFKETKVYVREILKYYSRYNELYN